MIEWRDGKVKNGKSVVGNNKINYRVFNGQQIEESWWILITIFLKCIRTCSLMKWPNNTNYLDAWWRRRIELPLRRTLRDRYCTPTD